MNPWKILNVNRKTPFEDIHKAFIKLAKKHHPDMGGDIKKFQLINAAHNMLCTKKALQQTLKTTFVACKNCSVCAGTGVKSKSKGVVGKTYTTCTSCDGSGLVINSKEIEDVIKL